MSKPAKEKVIAVIDIGSNSVRLVVYRGLKRNSDNIFNERVLCGLASGVSDTGGMHEKAMEKAHAALRRFAHLCDDMKVDQIDAVATAAVRDSENGADFIKKVQGDCGFKVQVLSGKEEAKLSAFGVLSGFPGGEGVVGDLGGGSLELAVIEKGRVIHEASLPIGPLRLLAGRKKYNEQDELEVANALKKVPWLEGQRGKPFYMVGGAWRSIAHIHVVQTGWPLPVLHGYRLEEQEITTLCEVISKQSASSLKEIKGIAARRATILPLSAKILSGVLSILSPAHVFTSGYGLREGILYKYLSPETRALDPLMTSVKEFSESTSRFARHGELLADWIEPIFPDHSPAGKRMREVACHISDISWNSHPDFKGDLAFTRTLVAPYVGVSHAERVQIALALFIAYGGKKTSKRVKKVSKICTAQEFEVAVTIGLAIRVGLRLTGGTGAPLKKTSLKTENGNLVLTIPRAEEALAGVVVLSKLKALADHLGLKGEVKIEA